MTTTVAAELEQALRRAVDGEVRFDVGTRAAYARDASHYRQVPIGVVTPRTDGDLEAAVAVYREYDAPILPRGGGTSLAGQCCNVAVVIDCSRHLDAVEEVDPPGKRAVVQPGVVLDDLQRAVAPHGLRFGPDPATHGQCTLGGMIGNNACGVRSVVTGRTVDNVESLEILTYDGERLSVGTVDDAELERASVAPGRRGRIHRDLRDLAHRYRDLVRQRFPVLPRRVSGYNLDELVRESGAHLARALVGSEGTCAFVTRAEVRLTPWPPEQVLAVLPFTDAVSAAARVPELLEHHPSGLEGLERPLVEGVPGSSRLPVAGAYLFAEVAGDDRGEVAARARALCDLADQPDQAFVVDEPADIRAVWAIRESGIRATTRTWGGRPVWPGWEDAAVPPARLAEYLAGFDDLMRRYDYHGGLYGHFGDGCVHVRVDFDLDSPEGRGRYRTFVEEAADLVVAHGGSLSGEHGDGQARGELLERMFGPELVGAFREFKAIWDPDGRMNPGKVVDARPLDVDLAAAGSGVSEPPAMSGTGRRIRLEYPEDPNGFTDAVGRCVGVGACRNTATGTMCPSYMATRDEVHSTRGRARLLQEMIRGDMLDRGWRSPEVLGALDLCLACKACAAECPVNVDMAAYKAEFLSHHYAGRLRPRSHYALGFLPTWARMASKVPRVANRAVGSRAGGRLLRWAGGLEPDAQLPPFAEQTFRRWFAGRKPEGTGARDVVLWVDTFTDRLDPRVGQAAVRVLEDAGYRVHVPARPVCCGLTALTHGMLGRARRLLQRAVRELMPLVDLGIPVVGLEPSCVAVFRDDARRLLSDDPGAGAVRSAMHTFAELLAEDANGWTPPEVEGSALIQLHCHQRAVLGSTDDEELWRQAGVDARIPDSGCCGLAGSFGLVRGHQDVAVACGERVLFPEVRAAGPDVALVADGFSCRTQIAQGTGRRAVHTAEVLASALTGGHPGDPV